jgi:hypothetical protein
MPETEPRWNILRLAPAAGRYAFEDLAGAVGIGAKRLGVVGRHVARRNRVDGDAVGRQLVGQRLGQAGDAVLGGGVGGDADAALEGKQRGDVDDAPGDLPAIMWRATDCDSRNRLFRFTCITASQSASE